MAEKMTDLHKLARAALALSIEKGFDRPTWENLPGKLMFIVSELDEVEATDTRGELTEELADCGLRTLAIFAALWDDSWSDRTSVECHIRADELAPFTGSSGAVLWPYTHRLCQVLTVWRDDNYGDARIHLEMFLRDLHSFAMDIFGIDIIEAMLAKHERNKTRQHLHGHKQSLG